jgi:hypothetical protein
MTEDDVVRIVRSYIEGLFPRVCHNCGRRFASLREYLETTTHLDSPILYADIGAISLAVCPCGSTLGVGSGGIPQAQFAELMDWARSECAKRSIGARELLLHLRERIDRQVRNDDRPPG